MTLSRGAERISTHGPSGYPSSSSEARAGKLQWKARKTLVGWERAILTSLAFSLVHYTPLLSSMKEPWLCSSRRVNTRSRSYCLKAAAKLISLLRSRLTWDEVITWREHVCLSVWPTTSASSPHVSAGSMTALQDSSGISALAGTCSSCHAWAQGKVLKTVCSVLHRTAPGWVPHQQFHPSLPTILNHNSQSHMSSLIGSVTITKFQLIFYWKYFLDAWKMEMKNADFKIDQIWEKCFWSKHSCCHAWASGVQGRERWKHGYLVCS